MKSCGACKLAYFCSKKCQKSTWKEHKRVCKSILRGRQMYLADLERLEAEAAARDGKGGGGMRSAAAAAAGVGAEKEAAATSKTDKKDEDKKKKKKKTKKKKKKGKKKKSAVVGFAIDFGACDDVVSDNGGYDRSTCPIWEYDAGERGKPL